MKQKLSEFSEWQEDNFFDGSFNTSNVDSSPKSNKMILNLMQIKNENGLS